MVGAADFSICDEMDILTPPNQIRSDQQQYFFMSLITGKTGLFRTTCELPKPATMRTVPTMRPDAAKRRAFAIDVCHLWILEHGHAGMRPAEAARVLGVSRAWVSRRLGTRRDILLEVASAMAQTVLSSLAEIPAGLPPAEHLRQVVQAIVPRLPPSHLVHAWGTLGETCMLWGGPAFYGVVAALEPWAGRQAAACAAAWSGILRHAASSATPWTRRELAGNLYTVAQGFRARFLSEAGS